MRITPQEKSPTFSLVFVNFRSADLLEQALVSLERNGALDHDVEVILVNNDIGEEKKVAQVAKKFSCALIPICENRGFGASINVAAREARGIYIGCINPDTEYKSGSLKDLDRFFKKYPKIGIAGARLVDGSDFSEKWSMGGRPSLFALLRNNLGISSDRRLLGKARPTSVGFVSGAALFIRKSVFDALSGFDEKFFLYFEDVDLCYRAKKEGFLVATFPSLVFFHKSGGSHESKRAQKQLFYESQEKYFMKHRPLWEYFLLKFAKKCMRISS